MDPLSIAGSATAIIQLITSTSSSIYTFIRLVRESRSDLDAIDRELQSIKRILEQLREDIDAQSGRRTQTGSVIQLEEQVHGILQCCDKAVRRIDETLGKYRTMDNSIGRQLKWAVDGRNEMQRLRSELESHKRALEIAVVVLAWAITREIKTDTSIILEDTTILKQRMERILEEIAGLQEQLPQTLVNFRVEREFLLQKYLENISTYTESAQSDIDIDNENTMDIDHCEVIRTSTEAFNCKPTALTWQDAPPMTANECNHRHNIHSLSPTIFLPIAADNDPHAIAIHHVTADSQTIRLTYRDFADRSRGLAYYLRKFNHKHVGILCPNTPAFIISIFGIAAAGAINTAANHRLNADEISYIFNHSGVDAVIVDWEFVGLLDRYRKDHPDVELIVDQDRDKNGEFYKAIEEGWQYDNQTGGKGWDQLEAQPIDENSLIAVAYTSGTTAKPKGAEYTHRGANIATMGNIIESGLHGRVRYLGILHMSHAMGWTFPWAVTAVCGTHYCLRKIDYKEIWKLLKEENITHFNASPIVNRQLCTHQSAEKLPNPVHVTVAGSSPSPRLFEMMTDLNLRPAHVYGLTETYGPITKGYHKAAGDNTYAKDMYQKMVRQGHSFVTSLPSRVIKTELPEDQIVNVKQDGKEIGEIVFVGNMCVKGYYKNPEATRELWTGGVMHSGDLAVWHEDGSIQVQGRLEDIIISGGGKFSSLALESMLETHPDILEAGIVAVADDIWGERPKAYVTLKAGAHIGGEELVEWMMRSNEISEFMVPREVEMLEEPLPRTGTGKLRKDVIREWAKTPGGKRRANLRNDAPNLGSISSPSRLTDLTAKL